MSEHSGRAEREEALEALLGSDAPVVDPFGGLPAPRRGRRAHPIAVGASRPLGPDEARSALARGEAPGALIGDLSTRHHEIAMLVAQGLRRSEVAAAVGTSGEALRPLLLDPRFGELVAYYRAGKEARYLDAHARLGRLGLSAAEALQERLDDPEERAGMSPGQILAVMESAMDRSIAPKKGGQGVGQGGGAPGGLQVNILFPGAPSAQPAGPVIDAQVIGRGDGDE